MKKAKVISLRLTESEYNDLVELAKRNNKNVSNYIREKVFKSPKLTIVPADLILTKTAPACTNASNVIWYDFGGDVA